MKSCHIKEQKQPNLLIDRDHIDLAGFKNRMNAIMPFAKIPSLLFTMFFTQP